MSNLYLKNVSSLEKVLPLQKLKAKIHNNASCLWDEEFSYQIAFKLKENSGEEKELKIEVISDINDCIKLFAVKNVPVYLPHFNQSYDDCYLSHKQGLYPDILEPLNNCVLASPNFYKSLWVSIKPHKNVSVGAHNIKIIFKCDGEIWGESNFSLDVIGAPIPKTDIPVTNWFHCDCIADYYNVKPLSKKHWDLIESFMALYTAHGLNMILTPIFTPALDTKIGLERPTVQLIDITLKNGLYSFRFDNLIKWMALCKKHGIEYLEISHLFSQWGAEHTPKIVVKQNGKSVKKFGWKTASLGEEYKDFLTQLLPPLSKVLSQYWDKEKVYFHISDEPQQKHIAHYSEIYKFLKPLLCDFKLMDAISDLELYNKGFIDTPVVATNETKPFLEQKVDKIWSYYCCMQGVDNYSNRFIAMPSFRNRIIGLQLYTLDIKGFLQWGYNFYYSRLSTHKINPYLSTDADGGFPAGDPFIVYPSENGAVPSLRFKVFHQGLQDMMAARLLESKIGKTAVLKIIEADGKIDFNHYPLSPEFIIKTREYINTKLKEIFP